MDPIRTMARAPEEAEHKRRILQAVDACRQPREVAAHSAHPERLRRGVPRPAPLPAEVWINWPAALWPAEEPRQ